MNAQINYAVTQLKTSHKTQKQVSIISFIIILLIYYAYSLYTQRYVSTDDSYINANVVQIASRITGQVSHLYVVNNQYVKQGQLLLEIDPAPFIVAANKAQAQLKIAEANLQDAQTTTKRVLALVKAKTLPVQAGDDAIAKLKTAYATVELDKAALIQANLNLQYTRVTAPVDGQITNMSLRAGNNVTANQPLFAFIDNNEFWVDANYKETQLENVKPGQKATIEVDMYPNHNFKGVVESISGGSGTAFSLLPPQNATGNWVKVTQRVPVRIKIINTNASYPLRIGTTATVTIDTHSHSNMR
jgi:membrane fusion protein (multidrug efflux system)